MVNARLGLIHSVVPATAHLRADIPEDHPSARNLGTERMGSGTVVDPDGFILTVHYVVLGAQSITVTLPDGDQFAGEVAAQDFESGLALVKIPAQDLHHLEPAPVEAHALGQPGVIVASSGETDRRVSGGYVTSMDSFDGQWEYLLEKTIRLTAFNPGFGGGALVDLKGRLAGVVSLNLNEIGKFSLAIPIHYYVEHQDELKRHGRVLSRPRRPWMGFYPQCLAGHIILTGVVPGGPADRGGLREGDIIVGAEKKQVRTRQELYRQIWTKRAGEKISFRILRDEEAIDLDIVSGDRWKFYYP
jgi:S1-C subfamily serine protease